MPVSEGAMILGALAAFFFCMMVCSWGLKLYWGKKAKEDEEAQQVSATFSASPGPSPAPASDVVSARDQLINGQGAKTIQVSEVDINTTSPPSIPLPFTINTDTPPEYTISFDIKAEKNLPMDSVFTVLSRGGATDDSNGQRPVVQIASTSRNDRWCIGPAHVNTAGCIKEDHYVLDKTNVMRFTHKPSLTGTAADGPQATQDFKNCTIVVKSTGPTSASAKIYWDATAGADIDSAGADWGNLTSEWKWAGGQTAVNNDIGAVKVRNVYMFNRALTDGEIATLLNRGATADTSTYTVEPKTASWTFDPSGYDTD